MIQKRRIGYKEIAGLRKALEKIWGDERQRCAVNVLFGKKYLGGTILAVDDSAGQGRHYFNVLKDGQRIDLTPQDNFHDTNSGKNEEGVDEEYLLVAPGTKKVFKEMAPKVKKFLNA